MNESTRGRPRLVVFALLAAIAGLIGLAGCGGSSDDDPAPQQATGASQWGEMVWGQDNWD